MKIKVYNENGVIRVTMITASGTEQTMFSNIQKGQVAEIQVYAEVSYKAHLNNVSLISEVKEDLDLKEFNSSMAEILEKLERTD